MQLRYKHHKNVGKTQRKDVGQQQSEIIMVAFPGSKLLINIVNNQAPCQNSLLLILSIAGVLSLMSTAGWN